jgi:hypothetical protein
MLNIKHEIIKTHEAVNMAQAMVDDAPWLHDDFHVTWVWETFTGNKTVLSVSYDDFRRDEDVIVPRITVTCSICDNIEGATESAHNLSKAVAYGNLIKGLLSNYTVKLSDP